MAKQLINIGTSPNKGDGDPLRTAFRKINDNFNELYDANFSDPGAIESSITPGQDGVYDLGSLNNRWADIHASDFLYLNGQRIEATSNGGILINGNPIGEVQDIRGSVFADDSTLLVDAVNGTIPYSVLSGTPTIPSDVADLTDTQGLLGGGGADTGNITFDNEIISAPNGANILVQAKDSNSVPNAVLALNSEFAVAKLESQTSNDRTFYSGEFGDFLSATWESYEQFGQQRSRLTFVGATSLHNFISNNAEFSLSSNDETGEWTVDGINFYPWPYSIGWAEETGTLTVDFYDAQVIPPPVEIVTIDIFTLRWINKSKVSVDHEDYSELEILGAGIGVKVKSTSSVNIEAGSAINVLAANDLNLESINGDVKIATAIYGNNSQWIFSPLLTGEGTVPAKITFPDGTQQTTAWAGGRVVPAPSTSLGASGDKARDMAFSSDYFYYCIVDHTDGSSTIWKRVAWSLDDNW